MCSMLHSKINFGIYDDVIRSILQSILNISLSEDAWCQASLPVSNGGIGVRSACQVVLPAFLSSVEASHQVIQQLLPVRLQHISGRKNPDFIEAVDERKWRSGSEVIQPPFAAKQKCWDAQLVNIVQDRCMQAAAPD